LAAITYHNLFTGFLDQMKWGLFLSSF
jgi:hypothetical protein